MKYLSLLICSLLLFACSSGKRVYWCGDHACINNKERESYFKKTMIVETRELSKQNKRSKSEIETIKKQADLEQKKEIKNEKKLVKQARLEEKRRIKDEKELARQVRLEKKKRTNNISKKEKKSSKKKAFKTENKEIIINTDITSIDISSNEFERLVERITKKNMSKTYPNINDIAD